MTVIKRLKAIKSNVRELLEHPPHSQYIWHDTLSDYARHTGSSGRHRLQLVAEGLVGRLHESADDLKAGSREVVKQAGVHLALRASRKLTELAERIERKARAIQRSE